MIDLILIPFVVLLCGVHMDNQSVVEVKQKHEKYDETEANLRKSEEAPKPDLGRRRHRAEDRKKKIEEARASIRKDEKQNSVGTAKYRRQNATLYEECVEKSLSAMMLA